MNELFTSKYPIYWNLDTLSPVQALQLSPDCSNLPQIIEMLQQGGEFLLDENGRCWSEPVTVEQIELVCKNFPRDGSGPFEREFTIKPCYWLFTNYPANRLSGTPRGMVISYVLDDVTFKKLFNPQTIMNTESDPLRKIDGKAALNESLDYWEGQASLRQLLEGAVSDHDAAFCCDDWEPGCKKLDAPVLFLAARNPHQVYYDGKPFAFCPWCGTRRPEVKPTGSSMTIPIKPAEASELVVLVRELLTMLETVEESDGGKEFRPTTIQTCRCMHAEKLGVIMPKIKALVEYKI